MKKVNYFKMDFFKVKTPQLIGTATKLFNFWKLFISRPEIIYDLFPLPSMYSSSKKQLSLAQLHQALALYKTLFLKHF